MQQDKRNKNQIELLVSKRYCVTKAAYPFLLCSSNVWSLLIPLDRWYIIHETSLLILFSRTRQLKVTRPFLLETSSIVVASLYSQ